MGVKLPRLAQKVGSNVIGAHGYKVENKYVQCTEYKKDYGLKAWNVHKTMVLWLRGLAYMKYWLGDWVKQLMV